MTTELSPDEMAWLLGLAKSKRKKRERDLPRIKQRPGQTREEFHRIRQTTITALNWARSVEDHLILILGEQAPELLREEYRDRLDELLRAA